MSSTSQNALPNEQQRPLLVDSQEFGNNGKTRMDTTRPVVFELVQMKGKTQMEPKSSLRMKRNADLPTINMPEQLQSNSYQQIKTPDVSISPIGNTIKLSMVGLPPVIVNPHEKVSITVFLPVLPSEEELNEEKDGKCGIKMNIVGGRAVQVKFLLDELARMYALDSLGTKNNVFALWMVSPLLEFQLKPHHKPWQIAENWQSLLVDHAYDKNETERNKDMPVLYLKRSVQLTNKDELAHTAFYPECLDILYNDARSTLLYDRYRLNMEYAADLAGVGFAIETENFDPKIHTPEYIRRNLETQLPDSLADSIRGPLLFGKPLSRSLSSPAHFLEIIYQKWKNCAKCAEANGETNGKMKLKQEYLAILREHSLQYGAAFFRGRIERPSASLRDFKRFFHYVTSSSELEVEISVNREYISVVDSERKEQLLVQKIADCSWRKIDDKISEDSDATRSVLLLHFPDDNSSTESLNETKKSRTNLLQIFGPQVSLLDAMLKSMKTLNGGSQPNSASSSSGQSSAVYRSHSSINSNTTNKCPVMRTPSLTKNDRMCLASFENGKYVRANGSLKRIDWKSMCISSA